MHRRPDRIHQTNLKLNNLLIGLGCRVKSTVLYINCYLLSKRYYWFSILIPTNYYQIADLCWPSVVAYTIELLNMSLIPPHAQGRAAPWFPQDHDLQGLHQGDLTNTSWPLRRTCTEKKTALFCTKDHLIIKDGRRIQKKLDRLPSIVALTMAGWLCLTCRLGHRCAEGLER